jgi:type II secretory pathway predicted ATPase ExeA
MYQTYYNLKAKPFQMSTDPKFLWLGEKHKEALATLKYAIAENKGVLALTGDVGTGKTTLINALIQSLGEDVISATIYDPSLGMLDFFNIVADAFNLPKKFSNKGEFLIYLRQFLIKALEKKQKVLLIIDEAQTISPELLEEIRLLSNLEEKHTRLLNIFFVGQNEFVDILQERKNRALRQRITINYNIESLTETETETYIKYRLRIAGTKALVFDAGAIREIFTFSGGYPRLINIICDHALLSGFVKEVEIISTDVIKECKKELRLSEWDSGPDINAFKEDGKDGHEKVEISEKDAESSDDEDAPIRLTRGLYREAPTFEPEKKPFSPFVLAVAVIVLIGGIVGYVYYNAEKGKNTRPGAATLKQNQVPYSKQLDSKKNDGIIVPPTQNTPDVQPGKKVDEMLSSGTTPETEMESGLLKDMVSEEMKSLDRLSSDQTADDIDIKDEAGEQELKNDESKPAAEIPASEKEPDKMQKQSKLPEKPQTRPIASKTSKKYETKQKTSTVKVASKSSEVVKKPLTGSVKDKQAVKIKKPKSSIKPLAAKTGTSEKMKAPVKKALKTSTGQMDLKFRLQTFLADYSRAYENKKLDKFTTFFTSDAVEDGKPFRSQLPKYRRNFEIIDSLNYKIDLHNYSVQKDSGLVRVEGIFYARTRLVNETDKWRQSTGGILMELASHGDSFRIKRLGSIERGAVKIASSASVQKAAPPGNASSPVRQESPFPSFEDLPSRLRAFLVDYSNAYESKKIDNFVAFFTPDALEKGQPFSSLIPKYRRNFELIDALNYRIDLKRYAIQENIGLIRIEATVQVRVRLAQEGGKWRQSSSGITMELEVYGDSFRIRRLDY